jgi:hypothetical protein
MKFLTYLCAFIFSFQAQAHDDHFLGEGFAHNLVHVILLFLLIAVVVTGVKWFRKRAKKIKD